MSRRVRSTLVGALLASWAIVVTLVASSLLARHLLPLPASDAGPLRSELAALRAPNETGFTVFHVLYAECRCSRRVAESLASSVRPPGVVEHVLLVDDEGGATRALLQNRGFVLHDVASTDLAPRFGVTSAP